MYSNFMAAFFLSSMLILSACSGGGGGGGGSSQRQQDPGGTGGTSGGTTGGTGGTSGGTGGGRPARLVYDSELSPQERQALDSGTAKLGQLAINGSANSRFSQIFGGNSSSSVVNYFETRVNYGLSESTDLNSRVVISLLLKQALASNPSVSLWFNSLLAEEEGMNLQLQVNNNLVELDSSRVGVMLFGGLFVNESPTEQAIILVHEARHSDCTGGVTTTDVIRTLQGLDPINPRCGHAHRLCPIGHPDAGAYACDEHPWGAYSISAVYGLTIAEHCSNCSEAEKSVAEALGLISVRRLLFSYTDLLNGVYGSPNMSNSTQVRNE